MQLAETRDTTAEVAHLKEALAKASGESEKLRRQLAEVVTLHDEEAVRLRAELSHCILSMYTSHWRRRLAISFLDL